MKRATTTATIENGILKLHNRKLFDECVRQISNGRCIVTVEKIYNKKSNQQNRYYWAVVVPMVFNALIQLGHDLTEDDTHEILKEKFLSKKQFTDTKTGEHIEFSGTTKDLKTIEMMEYIDKIIRWSSEFLNIFIPSPDIDWRFN